MLCARLPLALNIAAARAAARPNHPLAAVAAALRDERGRLDALDTGEPASSARTVFSWSYRNLSQPAARMFRLVTFSSAHPAITDGHMLPTPDIVDLLLHGIGAASAPAAQRSESQSHPVGVS